jgi:hypothetical protein
MNTNKFLIGGIIGGIAYFLLGWLVWGMLLMNFMNEHTTEPGKAVMRGEDNMVWWALIVGNLLWGLTLSYVFVKSGVSSAGGGAAMGAVLGLLISAAINCMLYAQLNAWDTTSMAVDIVANAVVGAIVGGIVGWYMGMGKKAAA